MAKEVKKKPIVEKMISIRLEDYDRIVTIAKGEQRTIRTVIDRMITRYEKS